jgi:hypothetical protein
LNNTIVQQHSGNDDEQQHEERESCESTGKSIHKAIDLCGLSRYRKELDQKLLMAARERGIAGTVGQEHTGRNDGGSDGLGEPALQVGIAWKIASELQYGMDVRLVFGQCAKHVPPLPRVTRAVDQW